MATGACGINCDVCRLHTLGVCSTCGPGDSKEGLRKIEVQKQVLGAPCPILACAHLNNIAYCLRDCTRFPCENFTFGEYPFGRGFYEMQKRRREEVKKARAPSGNFVCVPEDFWEELVLADPKEVCRRALVEYQKTQGYTIYHMNQDLTVLPEARKVVDQKGVSVEDGLLVLLTLLYLLNVSYKPFENRLVTVEEFQDAFFFQGPHELPVHAVAERFGNDPEGFQKACTKMGGRREKHGDLAFVFYPFPKIPVHYILWQGDREFSSRVSVLFDASTEGHLRADGIWGLVNLITRYLITAI